jgi:hypothetical protein
LKYVVSLQRQPAKGEEGDHNHEHLDDLSAKKKPKFSTAIYFIQLPANPIETF